MRVQFEVFVQLERRVGDNISQNQILKRRKNQNFLVNALGKLFHNQFTGILFSVSKNVDLQQGARNYLMCTNNFINCQCQYSDNF